MAISSDASTLSRSGGLRYVPFALDVYLREYKDYLNTDCFDAISLKGDVETIYKSRNGFDCDTAPGAWLRR